MKIELPRWCGRKRYVGLKRIFYISKYGIGSSETFSENQLIGLGLTPIYGFKITKNKLLTQAEEF